MARAVWCWEAARIRAFKSREAALKAAQRHEQIAEDWRHHVPQWQWDLYWEWHREQAQAEAR